MHRSTRSFVVILGLLLSPSILAGGVSALRLPGETFEQARERAFPNRWDYSHPTAEAVSTDWDSLDFTLLPVQKDVQELFELIRDERALHGYSHASFARRPSWLYPQDGCWTRASVVRRLAKDKGYGDLRKIFIFGNLTVSTVNAPGGSVSWWYHVVPIFQDSKGEPMVYDPAISPRKPLKLEDWVLTMVPNVHDATYSICTPATYSPGSPCEELDDEADNTASSDQSDYLDLEWDNLKSLGRDPVSELGTNPPWLATL